MDDTMNMDATTEEEKPAMPDAMPAEGDEHMGDKDDDMKEDDVKDGDKKEETDAPLM